MSRENTTVSESKRMLPHAEIDPEEVRRRIAARPPVWPGRVVPATDAHLVAAAAVITGRACWPAYPQHELVALLRPWTTAGWCPDALLIALDRTPDGQWLPSWTGHGDLLDHLTARLRPWWGDPAAPAPHHDPPVQGTPYVVWADRQAEQRAQQSARPRPVPQIEVDGAAGRAAALAYARSRHHRGLPMDRVQARDQHRDRVQTDLDKYLPPDMPTTADQRTARAEAATVDPADDLLLVLDPVVHRTLRTLAATSTPGRHHHAALRHAVRAARARFALERLVSQAPAIEATVLAQALNDLTGSHGEPVAYSDLRTLLRIS